jgi:glycosyltransferase involved in cell wall biosynthesis
MRHELPLIIVDYGCPDNTAEEAKKYMESRHFVDYNILKVHNVENTFNLNHARNIGFKHSTAKYVLFLPCDAFLTSSRFMHFEYDAIVHNICKPTLYGSDIAGTIFVNRWVVSRLGGFNEFRDIPSGWGYDSEEFIHRVILLSQVISVRLRHIDESSPDVSTITHEDELRVRFFDNKSPQTSYVNKKTYAETQLRNNGYVNSGPFGEAEYDVLVSDRSNI